MMNKESTQPMQLLQMPLAPNDSTVLRSKLNSIPHLLKSSWLFTFSDLKTIVGPCTVFAIIQQLGSSSFNDGSNISAQSITLAQILKVICWTWLSLLPFNIDNQRRSVEEDLLNKPWRPIPAGRMTSQQATVMMMVLYPVAVFFGILTGAHLESFALVGLGIWYNDLGGANKSWIVRNFINACGITCFLSGSLSVMLYNQSAGFTNPATAPHSVYGNSTLCMWLAIIFGIIFSGIQTQDMYDQVGDGLLNRKTMPLVLGDTAARWTIALPVLFFSWYCPYFWSLPIYAYVVPMVFGTYLAMRTLTKKSVEDDKKTSKLWNLWLVVFFTLPLQHAWLL